MATAGDIDLFPPALDPPAPNPELGIDAHSFRDTGYGSRTAHSTQHTAPVPTRARVVLSHTDVQTGVQLGTVVGARCSLLATTPPARLTYNIKLPEKFALGKARKARQPR